MARLPSAPDPASTATSPPPAPTLTPQEDAARFAQMLRRIDVLMIPVVLALAFLMASFTARNIDLWQHLAVGRLVATGQYHFGQDPFSHATAGVYWANHAWLSDTALYALYTLNTTGAVAVAVKALLVALTALVMLLACRPATSEQIAPGTRADPTMWFAALFTGVALVAMGPRMLLQPVVVSFLFTAVTFWLLNRDRENPGVAKLAVPIGILFAVWVNCDAWFIIGPALVALTLVGEALQRVLPGEGPQRVTSARLKALGVALGVGLAACLLNPHHVHAFAVPPDFADLNLATAYINDPLFKPQFYPVYSEHFFNDPNLGRNLAGACALVLFATGLLAMALNGANLRFGLILPWAALAALGVVRWRLLPFFEVIAVPVLVQNLHAWFARRPNRFEAVPGARGATEPSGDAAPAPVADALPASPAPAPSHGIITAETAAARTVSIAPIDLDRNVAAGPVAPTESPVPKSAGGFTVTLPGLTSLGGLMGRLFTLALGLVALALAYPGWLHVTTPNPNSDRHVAWAIEPNEAYRDLAEQFPKWRAAGVLPADAKLFCLGPDLGSYLAWYAPGERNFFDFRYAVTAGLSNEFIRIRRGLMEAANKRGEAADDWAGALTRRGVTHVVLTGTGRTATRQLMLWMLADDSQWTLWFLNGQTAVFAWRPPGQPAPSAPATIDPVRQGFGPQAQRLPEPASKRSTFLFPASFDEVPRTREFLDRYLYPPPIPSHDADVGDNYTLLYLVASERARQQELFLRAVQQLALAASEVGLAPGAFAPPMFANPLQDVARGRAIANETSESDARAAGLSLLAVREVWRVLLTRPDQAFPYLDLVKTYGFSPAVGSELRQLQLGGLLHQGLSRLTTEEVEFWGLQQLVTESFLLLVQKHTSDQRNMYLDVAAECLEQALKTYKKFPPRSIPPDRVEQSEAELQRQLALLQKELPARRERYLNESANRPPAHQAAIALNYGLAREALKVLESNISKLDPTGVRLLVQVLIALGRGEEALSACDQMLEDLARTGSPDPRRESEWKSLQLQFQQFKIRALIVAGYFARAGKEVDATFQTFQTMLADVQTRVLIGRAGASVVLGGLGSAGPLVRAIDLAGPPVTEELNAVQYMMRQATEHHAMRGMLALEEGDCATALKHLKEAVEPTGSPPVGFPGRAAALRYVEILKTQFPDGK